MKHFLFVLCIVFSTLQPFAQNTVTIKSIDNFEMGDDKEKFSGTLTDITDTAREDKRYKIKEYSYNTGTGKPYMLGGVPFKNITLEFAYDAKLCRITLASKLTKDSVLYHIDSSETYRVRLKKFIETALQAKSTDAKDQVNEGISAEILSSKWEKDERTFNKATNLYNWGNNYRVLIVTASIFDEKKKITEKWFHITLTNEKYYMMEVINGKVREY